MIEYIILLLVLVFLSAFFSGSEIAIFSLNKARLKALVNKGAKGAETLEDLKKDPTKLLITILIGNNVVNIGASALATMFAIEMFGNIGVGIATGVMTFLILVFGEITPKAYATQYAEQFSLKTAGIYKFLVKLLSPLVFIFEKITIFVTPSRQPLTKHIATEEELKALIQMSEEHGHVLPEERELIENVLRFNDIAVGEVMTHREDIFCMDVNLDINDAAQIVKGSSFSRFPIYSKTKDNIVGIVHIKDIFFTMNGDDKKKKPKKLKLIKNPALFVPEHMILSDLFKEFQKKRRHMAIIVNDHGEVIGLVTLEDLLEEIVGEIIDESDSRKKQIRKVDRRSIVVSGVTEIKAINSSLKIKLSGKPTDTISEVILNKIKKIPKKDEELKLGDNEIKIVDATKKKIKKVMIKKAI